MIDKTLVSKENLKNISYSVFQDLINKIKNKDISLPYTTQLSKSSYIKIDGLGYMFLNNGGKYIDLGNINNDKLDIDKIYSIFNIQSTNNITISDYSKATGWHIMPYITDQFASTIYDDKIYCIGGISSQKSIQIYDIKSKIWTIGRDILYQGYQGEAVYYNGKIYVLDMYPNSSKLQIYDIESNTWGLGKDIPIAGEIKGCVVFNGKIYYIGGYPAINKIQVYDILSDTWSVNYNTMITGRHGFGCIQYNGKIYCIGGRTTTLTLLNSVEIYDINANSWSLGANMPDSQFYFGCSEYKGYIYCMGMGTGTIDVYNISNNSWSYINDTLIPTGLGFACETYNNAIYYIGSSYIFVIDLPNTTFDISIPDSLYSKLNEIMINGDGTKIFHNDGKYKTIDPTYQIMNSDDINEIMNYCTS